MNLTAEILRERLDYCRETGIFRWKAGTRSRRAGDIAGTPCSLGYVSIGLCRGYYKAHRLAWLYVYGGWPLDLVDHIDGNTANNRISNLRLASRSENGFNRFRQQPNLSGYKGVYQGGGKFRAQAKYQGKKVYLGSFKTAEEAAAAYDAFAIKHHGDFYNSSHRVPEIQEREVGRGAHSHD